MLRHLLFALLCGPALTCAAQSGMAYSIHCDQDFEIPVKRTREVLAKTDPTAVISFAPEGIKVRFSEPSQGATFQAFLEEAGLAQCRTRPLQVVTPPSEPTTTEGTIGTGADQRRVTVIEH